MLHKEQFSDKHIINEYYSSDLSFRCFILKPFCFAASEGDRSSRLGDGCQRDHTLGRVPCLGQPVSLQLPAIAPLGSGAFSRAAGVSTAARAMALPPVPPEGLSRYEALNLIGRGSYAKVVADIRVAVALHYITANSYEGRLLQLASFRTLIAETCATLRLNDADTGRVKSILHERKHVQLIAGLQRPPTLASIVEDDFTAVD